MTQDMELVRDDERDDVPTLPMVTDEMIRHAEKSFANIEKARQLSLGITNKHDWHDFGGKPYLNEGGACKVAQLFGVTLEHLGVTESTETIDGRTIRRYTAKVRAHFGANRTVEDEGAASSDDKFFGEREGAQLPLGEVNLNNVRKKAISNAYGRVLKRILGLKNLTWEDVRGAGVQRGTISGVQFKGKSAGGSTADSSTKVQLKQALIQLAALTGQEAPQILKDLTFWRDETGKERFATDVDRMSDKWIARALEKAQQAIDEHLGGGIPDEPREPGAEG